MDDICRLCCSTKFVSNNIFDEEGALYLKMSLYLPIKVYKNDGLPHKVCDKCSCKVNDLYQFCNETIEVQARLRAILMSNTFSPAIVDLTRVKRCSSPVPDHKQREQSTQTDWNTVKPTWNADKPTWNTDKSGDHIQTPPTNIQIKQECVNIPTEDTPLSPVKEETYDDGGVSDNSDNISLLKLKKKKSDKSELNGVKKKGRKKKEKLKDWDMLMNVLPETSLGNGHLDESYKDIDVKVKGEIQEQEELHCCICFEKHYSQYDLLQHYNKHAVEPTSSKPPILPPLPEKEPYRCIRCDKTVSAEEWSSHWVRHWRIDTRPYRCGVCDKSFRSPRQILKHGLTHRSVETQLRVRKPFACELCGDTLASLRSLAAHRVRSHPESAARPLLLSCAECGRRFAHANSLRRHLRAHSGERNFLCNVCGKALSSREHLKFHIRIHTGDKRNVCGVCGKGFVKKSNLTLHERVHSGEKPHVCSHCGKAFSQRSTLVIHERYHSGARPYQCSLCGRGFVAKGLLTMHLKSTCI